MKKQGLCMILAATTLIAALPLSVCQAEELKAYSIDFDDFTSEECASPGTVMQAISDRTGLIALYSVNGGKQIRMTGSGIYGEDNADKHKNGNINEGKILEGINNNIVVEEGKLKIKRDFSYKQGTAFDSRFFSLTMNDADKITSGGVRICFDIEFPVDYNGGYNTNFVYVGNTAASFFNMNFHDSRFYLAGKNETAWNAASGLLTSGFMTGKHSIDMTLDIDNGTVYVNVDGVSYGKRATKDTASDLSIFQINHGIWGKSEPIPPMDIYLDNILIEQVEKPVIADSNISDNAVAVPLAKPSFSFNVPMSGTALDSIRLYEGGVESEGAEFVLSEDRRKLTLLTPLQYSTPYSIKFGDGFYAENGLSIVGEEIDFHTMHKPIALIYNNDLVISDAVNSQPLTTVTGGMAVKAAASFSNKSIGSNETAILILAVYSADEMMEDIKLTRVSVPKGGTESAELSLTLPEDMSGKQLRAYVWTEYSNIMVIVPSQTVNGA